jgi:photosystem II stability/assembly factor-like uncharacterized protein
MFQPILPVAKKPLSYLLAFSICLISCNREMYEQQVNIRWGGRIVGLTKSPANDNNIIAAAQSGGLFATTSGGNTWKHIKLPVFQMNDVEYSPSNSNHIIATSNRDLKTKNGGGIWQSRNGGKTWTHKLTSGRFDIFFNPAFTAYGISFERGTSNIYVGTDDGVAVSSDNGLNWTFRDIPTTDNFVYSVLANGGRVLATTSAGIYRSVDAGLNWTRVSVASCRSTRALALVGQRGNHVLAAEDNYKIFYSSDFGQNWIEINSAVNLNRKPFWNREPFIRATSFRTTFIGAPITVTQIFYGDGVKLHRKLIPNGDASTLDFNNRWEQLTVAHDDPSEVLFSGSGVPILLATDGGIESTADQGTSWTMSGSSGNGLNALQVNEANAQEYFDRNERRRYVYFGTQDNNLWASADGGINWNNTGNEGHSIQTRRRATLPQGNLVTWAQDDSNQYYCSEQGFINARDWKQPGRHRGDAVILPPFDLLDANPQDRFFQMSVDTQRINIGINGLTLSRAIYRFHQTANGGVNWKTLASTFKTPSNMYAKAGFKTETVLYQPYIMATPAADGSTRVGLMRISKLGNPSGKALVEQADLNGFGSLGINPTEFLYYNVFAVNPSNPDHVIIADALNKTVKVSHDAGQNWYAENGLTNIITGNGAFKMSDWGGVSLVTSIAFNPDDTKQVAIGTRENGIFFTWNAGQTWYQLKNTTHITYITSITFYFDKTLLVSTYGRGLWRVTPQKSNVSSFDPKIPYGKGFWEWRAVNGAIDTAGSGDGDGSRERMIEVDTTLQLNLKKLFSGERTVIDVAGMQLKLPILSDEVRRKMRSDKIDEVPIRAFAINADNMITSAILSHHPYRVYRNEEIEVKDTHEAVIEFYSLDGEPITRARIGDSVQVQGLFFSPGRVDLVVNDSLYRMTAEVGADSSFRLGLRLPAAQGRLKITARQMSERKELTVVNEIIIVRGEEAEVRRDEREEKRPGRGQEGERVRRDR